jgi:hypothetical protein
LNALRTYQQFDVRDSRYRQNIPLAPRFWVTVETQPLSAYHCGVNPVKLRLELRGF